MQPDTAVASLVGSSQAEDDFFHLIAASSELEDVNESPSQLTGTIRIKQLTAPLKVAGSRASSVDPHVIIYVCNPTDAHSIIDARRAQKSAPGGPRQPAFVIACMGDRTPEVEKWADECNHSRCFYGIFDLPKDTEAFLWVVAHSAVYPAHVLWDRTTNDFTPIGWRAVTRLFWWLDEDTDKHLNNEELVKWMKLMKEEEEGSKADVSKDVEGARSFIMKQQGLLDSKGDVSFITDIGVTRDGFIALCELWLSSSSSPTYWGALRGLWHALKESGVGLDGLPWTKHDLHAVSVDPTTVLQLSFTAVQFLTSVFTERFKNIDDLWSFTPGTPSTNPGEPPWADLELPGSRTSDVPLTLETFLSCWRFHVTRNHRHLIIFARCWDFAHSEDPHLLFVKKRRRGHRKDESDLPNLLQCVLLGSQRCGKTSLRKRLSGVHDVLQYGGTSSGKHEVSIVSQQAMSAVGTPVGGRSRADSPISRVDIVLHELPDRDVVTLLQSKDFMSHIDAVLMCYDADDPYSFSYIAEKYRLLHSYKKLPKLLVMTKVDLAGDDFRDLQDQEYSLQPHEFAERFGLIWPPAMVSCAVKPESKTPNDIDDLPRSIEMICRDPEDPVEKGNTMCILGLVATAASIGGILIWKMKGRAGE